MEEIFGGIQNSYFTVKMSDGVVATSYAAGDKFYIDPAKLLPLERFLPQPKGATRGGRGGASQAPHQSQPALATSKFGALLERGPAVDTLESLPPALAI